jgi:hypothetical protein
MKLIVEGGLDNCAKPVIDVNKRVEVTNKDYFGVVTADDLTNETTLHLYETIEEAMTKYKGYIEKLATSLDPIEIDEIKHLKREVLSLVPIFYKSDPGVTDKFVVKDLICGYRNF